MRRHATWLVVAAVVGLGLAATVDALVGPEEKPAREASRRTTTRPLLARQPELAVSQLREAGVSGLLTFSDEDCRLHAVSLPELEPVRAPSFRMCRPLTSTGGLGAVDGEVVWSGLGYGTVQVVLSEEQLSRAIRAELGMEEAVDARFRAVQAVSLDDERFVVLADSTYRPRERVLAAFDGGKAAFVQPRWLVGDARAIRPSPRGGYYALLGRGFVAGTGFPVYSRDGLQLAKPEGIPRPHAVTWSADERWTALATDESVYVYPTEEPERLVVRIPISVRDLDWSE